MRKLFYAILLAALAYSGYWLAGSTAQKAALQGWLDQQAARGWVAEAEDISVTGYPNRFDAIVSTLELADPSWGWAWSAPEFQVLALSYKPNHIIAVWPPQQRITTDYETIEVTSDLMRGSVRFAANTGLALQETRIELKNVEIASTLNYTGGVKDGLLAIRRLPKEDDTHPYEIVFDTKEYRLAEPIKQALDPANALPPALEVMNIRAIPVFDGVWDRAAIEGRKPQLTQLRIPKLQFTWGRLDLTLEGTLDVDADGFAMGRMTLEAKNWEEIVDLSERAYWITPKLAASLKTGLAVVAQASGDPNTLNVPLTFQDGEMRLGPVPLGRAPVLRQWQ
ncbi:DUF2125 domain-containing protein [Halovulum sp. GXIMD14793]